MPEISSPFNEPSRTKSVGEDQHKLAGYASEFIQQRFGLHLDQDALATLIVNLSAKWPELKTLTQKLIKTIEA